MNYILVGQSNTVASKLCTKEIPILKVTPLCKCYESEKKDQWKCRSKKAECFIGDRYLCLSSEVHPQKLLVSISISAFTASTSPDLDTASEAVEDQ